MIVAVTRITRAGRRGQPLEYIVDVKSVDDAIQKFYAESCKGYPENWTFEFEEFQLEESCVEA